MSLWGLAASGTNDASKRRVPLRYAPSDVPPVTRVRSTLTASSLRAISALGLISAYKERLPSHLHATLLGAVAGTWLDIETAMEHYRAVDSLGIDPCAQVGLGETVGATVRSYLVGTAGRVARAAGVTPWVILPYSQRTWDRLYVGGDVSIEDRGSKQFIRTTYGLPLTSIPYFRNASRGVVHALVSRWCETCDVIELAATATTHQLLVSWR